MTKNTEYKIEVNYDIRDYDEQCDYRVEFAEAIPNSGKILLRLTGINGESNEFQLNEKTKSADSNRTIFDVTNVDIGEIKYATILYEDKLGEYDLNSFKIIDPDGYNYLFELDGPLRSKKEKIIRGKIVSQSQLGNLKTFFFLDFFI